MKHLLRIPTTEQYAYIEAEFEGTSEGAFAEYNRLTDLVKGIEAGPGLTDKEFNAVFDNYRATGKVNIGADVYAEMNKAQQDQIQSLKRSFARTK